MSLQETYRRVCSELEYDTGLMEELDQARSPVQRQLFSEAQRLISDIDALYFSGDAPVIYFRRLIEFDEDRIKKLHQRIWNQNRVPLLYVITPGELRIYDCFRDPARPESEFKLDAENRLIKCFDMARRVLEGFEEFSRPQIDSGAFWKSQQERYFRADRRVDYILLERLRKVRKNLREKGLDYSTIHKLLGRSIFILYLEDRAIITDEYYGRFLDGATTLPHILKNVRATYNLFAQLESKFNGDLFPVTNVERRDVGQSHLNVISHLLMGTEIETGQMALWRPWDFSIIPIELVSAIYEEFLHEEEGRSYASETGIYYTPHPLVEFTLNEVLPWPSSNDHQWELRILDPACGSGIFLVEAFRRLVARWKFSHNTDEVSPEELTKILTEHIFGIDISPDAIGVASFSLYLALSDHLESNTIWEEFRFPHLIYNPQDPQSGGRNLFPMDTIPKEASSIAPFENSEYDIVVGNPPWKRDGLAEHISAYCSERGFAQEKAQAFLWRARDFTIKGKIALIAPSKTLVNIESKDKEFRRRLFEDNYVETVVNFSALNKASKGRGRQLFASAVWPASVFIYSPSFPEEPKSSILYCTPKPKATDNALPGIIIDASEIKFLPREKCATSDIIWKVAMWATQRDLELIEKLRNTSSTLDEYIPDEEKGRYLARGLQRPDNSGLYKDEDLAELPLIPTESVKRYWLDKDKLGIIGKKYFFRKGRKETYYAPHILLKRGPSRNRVCAMFADFDCAFTGSIYGIAVKSNEESHLKALTAYLNSSFASYFLFLTASMWGVERPRISKSELLELPGVVFEMSEAIVRSLAEKVDQIQKFTFNGIPERDARVRKLEAEVERIIYEALSLSEAERMLIEDVLEYSIGFFNEGDTSRGYDPVSPDELTDYAKTFCVAVNSILHFGQSRASATVYAGEAPLCLVSVHFNTSQENISVQFASERLQGVLANLDEKIQTEYSENLYVRRNIKIYDRDVLHIVKSNEKRFWTRSTALRDADEVLAEGIRGSRVC